MKKILFLYLIFSIPLGIASTQNYYVCLNGPQKMYSEPNNTSKVIEKIETYESIEISTKFSESIFNGIDAYWYKAIHNGKSGFIWVGYGEIIDNQYSIKSIEDIYSTFSQYFTPQFYEKCITVYKNVPMVISQCGFAYGKHYFNLSIYYRPTTNINVTSYANIKNIPIKTFNSVFGMGSSYQILIGKNASHINTLQMINSNNDKVIYFYDSWGSDISYDIASFLIEKPFNPYFDGLIISFTNLWLQNDESKIKLINERSLKEINFNKDKNAVLYILIHDIIKHMNFDLVD